MTALRASFPFKAHGIYVEREVLGRSYEVEADGVAVTVTLPAHRDDLRTWGLLPGEGYWAIGPPSSGTVDDPEQRVSIFVVQVSVDVEADVDEATVRAGDREAATAAVEVLDSAFESAVRVMRDFVGWARTGRQSWLGLSTDVPELAGPSSLIDVASGGRVPVSHTQRMSSRLPGEQSALSERGLETLWAHIGADDAPPLAETLLADAEHLAWAGGEPADPVRSILMAAIACEVKVKAVLRHHIDPKQEPLLDYILENPREVTVTAVGLFDKLMTAAQGRSLRRDDKELYKRITRLFEVRNAVAHRGERPTPSEFADLVRAARQAFNWLDSVEASGTDPTE